MRAIQITEFGGPEVLVPTMVPEPKPEPGQMLIRVSRSGVNYADTHQAEDTYLAKQELPLIPGAEVVGTTNDGRRVVALVEGGGYAEYAAAHPQLAFDVPDAVSDSQALALVLQGVTAWHLLRTSGHMATGETVVVHAAAGGVGSIAVQLAKAWGAGRVIAVASTREKRELAQSLGADVAIAPDPEDLTDRIKEANGARKVDVILEMTGGEVFDASMRALAPFGRLVTFGMASRATPKAITAGELMGTSRAVIGFWLAHCFSRPHMIADPMRQLLAMTVEGQLRPLVGGDYPLTDARRAHEDIRSRRTTGKLVLDPSR